MGTRKWVEEVLMALVEERVRWLGGIDNLNITLVDLKFQKLKAFILNLHILEILYTLLVA